MPVFCRPLPAVAVIALLACAASAWAESRDGLRCGTRIVGIGDSAITVVERCGNPVARTTRTETRFTRNGRPYYVTVDEWLYRLGSRSCPRRVLFENGMVTSIEALPR
jgi:hypothetical protein